MDGNTLTLRFDTAWSAPRGWLCAVFNTIKAGFEYNYLSEGETRGHAGFFNWARLDDMGGEAWGERDADDALNRHLHVLLWGDDADEIMGAA